MKKILTSLVAASMAMTMTIPVFAETESQEFVIAEQGELSKLEESLNPNDYAGLYYEGEQLKIAIKGSVPNGAMAYAVAKVS